MDRLYKILFINLGENKIRSETCINIVGGMWKFCILNNKHYLKQ